MMSDNVIMLVDRLVVLNIADRTMQQYVDMLEGGSSGTEGQEGKIEAAATVLTFPFALFFDHLLLRSSCFR